MTFKDLKKKLKATASAVAREAGRAAKERAKVLLQEQVAEAVAGAFRVDKRERTLAIADKVLIPALRMLAGNLAPEAEFSIDAAPEGFRVGALLGGKRVTAVVDLARLRLQDGVVEVVVGTPKGVALAGRPVAQLFAGLVAKLFGGTWLGLKLLSAPLPSKLTWDGKTATLVTDLDPKGVVPAELKRLGASASVTKEETWTTFKLDRSEVLEVFGPFIGRVVTKLLGAYFFKAPDGDEDEA